MVADGGRDRDDDLARIADALELRNALFLQLVQDRRRDAARNDPNPDWEAPSDLAPREARDRFLEKRSMENSDKTIRSYDNRLTRWVHWCEECGVERVDADPDTIKRYYDKTDRHRKMAERREGYTADLDIVGISDEEENS